MAPAWRFNLQAIVPRRSALAPSATVGLLRTGASSWICRFSAVTAASQKVSENLKIAPGSPVYCIERLRFVNNEPIVLVTTYLPQALCAGLERFDLGSRSLYEILEKEFGLILSHGRRTIEAVAASLREAELLHVEEYDPMVLLDSVTFLKDGTPGDDDLPSVSLVDTPPTRP